MQSLFLLNLQPCQEPLYLLEGYLLHFRWRLRPLGLLIIQQLFGRQYKTVLIIAQDLDGILLFVAEDEDVALIIRVQLELEADQSGQACCYLFPGVYSPTGQENTVSPDGHICRIIAASSPGAALGASPAGSRQGCRPPSPGSK